MTNLKDYSFYVNFAYLIGIGGLIFLTLITVTKFFLLQKKIKRQKIAQKITKAKN